MAYTATAQYPSRINGPVAPHGHFSTPVPGAFLKPLQDRSRVPKLERAMTAQDPVLLPADQNIMNKKGGLSNSLYQSCLTLKRRLAEVPGFEFYLVDMDQEELDQNDASDPVTSVWNMLRRGFPLMTIYNALQPKVMLDVDYGRVTEAKLGKAATFKFLQACLEDLQFPPNEVFLITDLYGQDTTGFVKVLRVVNRVLDILEENGKLVRNEGQLKSTDVLEAQPTQLQNVITELMNTERDYVQHLETLQQFKNMIEQYGAIPGDAVHGIFLNLNALLDFQRRFLIRIEQQNSLEASQQNWGLLFVQYQDAFSVYEPFIANQNRCNAIVTREWEKIKMVPKLANLPESTLFEGMVTGEAILNSFIIKPFQRLTKYPLFLKEMERKADFSEEKVRDLQAGADACIAILARANQAIDRESRNTAVKELQNRVEDWKGHQIDHFGDLVAYGNHTVLKGEGQREVEREYKIYLFERILLCCKEVNPNKSKSRLANKTIDKRVKPRLQLKGRIFMQNVTDILSFSKQGSHFLQIFWRGDPGVENFVIRFALEETRAKWHAEVESQTKQLVDAARGFGRTGTSETEFTSMKTMSDLRNPYEQEDDGEEEEERAPSSTSAISRNEYSMSRNASSTSLRSRATAGASSIVSSLHRGVDRADRVGGLSRVATSDHVFGPNGLPLTISTNVGLGQMTPDERVDASSYFSPTAESPSSMRSSSQAGLYNLARQQSSLTNIANGYWTSSEENKHNTVPAVGRNATREDQTPVNTYTINGRTVQRPSLPVMTASQSAQQLSLTQSRIRSASSPDFQNANTATGRRYVNGQMQPMLENVPVPPIPAHMASFRTSVNRSQTSSPTDIQRNSKPTTQSPKALRDPIRHPNPNPWSAQERERGLEQSALHQQYDQPQMTAQITPYRYDSDSNSHASSEVEKPRPGTPLSEQDLEIKVPFISQLKVKVHFEPRPSHVTIVVPTIIKYQILADRIDSKMEKVTTNSIAKRTARLRYRDSDNEFVTMTCDDDIPMAIEEWYVVNKDSVDQNMFPDFELFWVTVP